MLYKEAKNVAEMLKVLANENRLLIVCYLLEKPMTVSELHTKFDNMTQSALSQHLALLKAHRILDSKKTGLNITYSIQDERISKVIESLKINYCNSFSYEEE